MQIYRRGPYSICLIKSCPSRCRRADTVFDIGSALKELIGSTAVGGVLRLVGYASGMEAQINIFEAALPITPVAINMGETAVVPESRHGVCEEGA